MELYITKSDLNNNYTTELYNANDQDFVEWMQSFCEDDRLQIKDIRFRKMYKIPAKAFANYPNLQVVVGSIISVEDQEDLDTILDLQNIVYINVYLTKSQFHEQYWKQQKDEFNGHMGFVVQLNGNRVYYTVNKDWIGTDYKSLPYLQTIYDNYPTPFKLFVANNNFQEDLLVRALEDNKSLTEYQKSLNNNKLLIWDNVISYLDKVPEILAFTNTNSEVLPHIVKPEFKRLWHITLEKPKLDNFYYHNAAGNMISAAMKFSNIIHPLFTAYLIKVWGSLPYRASNKAYEKLGYQLFSYLTYQISEINAIQLLDIIDPINMYDALQNLFDMRDFVRSSVLSKEAVEQRKELYGNLIEQNFGLAQLKTDNISELSFLHGRNSNIRKEITLMKIIELENNLNPIQEDYYGLSASAYVETGQINNRLGPNYI